jgi:hypothetical protein
LRRYGRGQALQSYEVIQKHVPFLVTVCTKKPSGGNATM